MKQVFSMESTITCFGDYVDYCLTFSTPIRGWFFGVDVLYKFTFYLLTYPACQQWTALTCLLEM